MPTYRTAKVAAGVQPKYVENGVVAVSAVYNVTTALALNDVIEMVKVPAGATIQEVILSTSDLDTGGSPAIVLAVGDGASTARYITGSTIGQTGGLARLGVHAGHGYTYTADDTIDVLVSTGPATGASHATDITVELTVFYSMDA